MSSIRKLTTYVGVPMAVGGLAITLAMSTRGGRPITPAVPPVLVEKGSRERESLPANVHQPLADRRLPSLPVESTEPPPVAVAAPVPQRASHLEVAPAGPDEQQLTRLLPAPAPVAVTDPKILAAMGADTTEVTVEDPERPGVPIKVTIKP